MRSPPRPLFVVAVAALVLASTAGAAGAGPPTAAAQTQTGTDSARTDSTPSLAASTRPANAGENASVAVWRVPAYVDAANASASDVAAYHDPSNASDDDRDDASADDEAEVTVTPEDRLAVAVHVTGLDARVANASGNRTERVLAALNASGHFLVRQTRDTTTPERQGASLWLNASNVRALDAPGTDRYVLVVDPEGVLAARFPDTASADDFAATYATGEKPYRFFELDEETFDARAAYTARFYAADAESDPVATSRRVRFHRTTASVRTGRPLERTANETVVGVTNVAPGTELVVTASTDEGVLTTDRVAVSDDGTFVATLDLAAVDRPTVANVTVATASNRNRTLGSAEIPVREPVARIAFPDQTSTTRYVNAKADLTHGGVLVLRNTAGVVDTSTTLAPGRNQTVTFTLPANATNGTYRVVAYHVDADGNRTDPYPHGTADATLEFADDDGATTTTTTTTTTTPTTTATTASRTTPPTSTATSTRTTTETTTSPPDDPIPGFGALPALAAVATLAGIVLAGRHRES